MALNLCMSKRTVISLLFTAFYFLSAHFYLAEAKPQIVKKIDMKIGAPIGLDVDETEGRLFVLTEQKNAFVVINEKDFNIIQTIPIQRKVNSNIDSHSVAYDQALNRIYVTTGDDYVLAINGTDYEILFEIKGETHRFIPDVATDENYLYLLDWYGYVHKYNKNGKGHTSIKLKNMGSAYMNIGALGRLYIGFGERGLGVVDAKLGKEIAIVPINALSIPESRLNTVYVAGTGKLYVVDAKTLKVKRTLDIDYPHVNGLGTALNHNTGHLFVVTKDNTVTVIDTKKLKIVDKLKVCKNPRSIVINQKTNTVYVACTNSQTIAVIKDE